MEALSVVRGERVPSPECAVVGILYRLVAPEPRDPSHVVSAASERHSRRAEAEKQCLRA